MGIAEFDPTSVSGTLILSLIAAIIVAVLGWIIRPLRRWLADKLTRLIATIQTFSNRLLGNEVIRVFANRRSLDDHLLRDFKHTTRVFMITGRGIQIQSEPPFTYLFNERNAATHFVDIRIVLPVSNASRDVIDWTEINERSMRAIDPAYGKGTLSKQLDAAFGVFSAYKANGKIEDVKRSNIPHFARIIITDSGVYLNPYNEERLSLQNKVLKFRRDGELARLWERIFRLLWINDWPAH